MSQDFSDVGYTVKIDSCKATELVDAYETVKTSTGLAGALGSKWWPIGTAGGVLCAWAWNNQVAVKGASAAGRGVQFDMQNGIVLLAKPQ